MVGRVDGGDEVGEGQQLRKRDEGEESLLGVVLCQTATLQKM